MFLCYPILYLTLKLYSIIYIITWWFIFLCNSGNGSLMYSTLDRIVDLLVHYFGSN